MHLLGTSMFPLQKSIWADTAIKSAHQAFQEGVTTGIQIPSGKGVLSLDKFWVKFWYILIIAGRRLIIIDIGNEDGALPGAREVWICGKKNQESKINWFDFVWDSRTI